MDRGPALLNRLRVGSVLMLVMMLEPPTAHSQRSEGALMPKPGDDFSAYRVDSDVFGWNRDFTEMGALGMEVRRYPKGKQRGEAFLLVFDIGAVEPKHNVHSIYITQADAPHAPLPIADVRDKMWAVDFQYRNMWPKRPKRKHFKGAMTVEPIWEFVETKASVCQPAVGFIMRHKGQSRFLPLQRLTITAPCNILQKTDHRVYWAKRDLAAVMIRFDFSPNEINEMSARYPLSASWKQGKRLNIVALLDDAHQGSGKSEVLKAAGNIAQVRFERTDRSTPQGVEFRKAHRYLALRFARLLRIPLGQEINEGPDLRVIMTSTEPSPAEDGSAFLSPQRTQGSNTPPLDPRSQGSGPSFSRSPNSTGLSAPWPSAPRRRATPKSETKTEAQAEYVDKFEP